VFRPGVDGLIACAVDDDVDIVVVATSGIASLPAVVAGIEAGKIIALANKESLVCAADVILPSRTAMGPTSGRSTASTARSGSVSGASRVPISSPDGDGLGRPVPDLGHRADGGHHAGGRPCPPHLVDGRQDNGRLGDARQQGLEVIEAHHLFGVPYDDISVVVHPQSIVHSLASSGTAAHCPAQQPGHAAARSSWR
jgi:1-deoxy-D-xylulose-5-phosphate reductoisomerase